MIRFRVKRKYLARLLGPLLALVLISASYHSWATYRAKVRYPPTGRMIDLGTHRLHCDIEGEGGPVVVINVGGISASWLAEPIQDELAKSSTVCTFDRAGYFHSESGPLPRTTPRIVDETRAMLRKAGLNPPYVLIGASLGGEHMRYFASKYPEDVAGLILVEAFNNDVWPADGECQTTSGGVLGAVVAYTSWMGSARIVYPLFFGMPERRAKKEVWRQFLATGTQTKEVWAVRHELKGIAQEWRTVREDMRHLGRLPVVAISSTQPFNDFEFEWWPDAQKALRTIADDVETIEVDCSHGILVARPDVIVDAAKSLLEELRRESPVTLGEGSESHQ